jgi:hypothetical protein
MSTTIQNNTGRERATLRPPAPLTRLAPTATAQDAGHYRSAAGVLLWLGGGFALLALSLMTWLPLDLGFIGADGMLFFSVLFLTIGTVLRRDARAMELQPRR